MIHFTEMAFNGVNYQVDAYALQSDTLLANVATDVNHRYFSRGVWPAILTGIGGVGEMYAQANTQVVSNQFSTTTTRPSSPDAKAVGGAFWAVRPAKAHRSSVMMQHACLQRR